MSTGQAQAVITGGEGDLARSLRSALETAGMQVDAPGRARLDVTNADMVKQYFNRRQPELLVCNAGITRDQPIARLPVSDWQDVMRVNLLGAISCCRAAIAGMKGRGGDNPSGTPGAHVVLISSFSAQHPPVGQSAYATAKAALIGLVSDLSLRHGGDNIRVNAVLPGFLETRMTAAVSEDRRRQVLAHHTLGRFNTCERVAAFITFLHQQMPHTSGQVFQLDSRLGHR